MLRLTRLARNAALCALLAAPSAALAQQGDTQTDPQRGSQSSQSGQLDSVLSKLDQKNQQEIQLGLLGIVRAESDEVAEFAKTMATDHSDAVVRIYELARNEKVKLQPRIEGISSSASGQPGASEDRPTAMGSSGASGSGREQIQRLTQLQGAEFDRAYVSAMVSSHEQMLQELQQAQQTVTNEEAKKLLGDLVSKVEDHRDTARELAQKVGASSQQQQQQQNGTRSQQQQQQEQQRGQQGQEPGSQRPDASR